MDDPHPYCRCMFYSANALARGTTRVAEEAFAPSGLAPSAAYVLMQVLGEPGIAPGRLAEIMMLDASTVTRVVERLERKGLLKRRTQGRRVRLMPTSAAEALRKTLSACAKEAFRRFGVLLGPRMERLTGQVFEAARVLDDERGP